MVVLLSEAAPTLLHVIKHNIVNMHITKLLNVCERLLEKLVKELLLANFTMGGSSVLGKVLPAILIESVSEFPKIVL